MTTNIILHELMNTKTIAEFADYIKTRVQTSTKAWLEIAQAFADAKAMYGGESDAFRGLLKETKFGRATAYKLASISTSKRLKKYEDKLSAVHSWNTLYKIHSLTDEQFEKVKQEFHLDDKDVGTSFITINKIEALFKKKNEETSFKLYAAIKIDEDAMRGELFDGADYENLENLLQQIQNIIPYLKVIRTDVDGKIESEFQDKVMKNIKTIGRQKLNEAVLSASERHPNITGEKAATKFKRLFGISKDELLAKFINDPKEAFEFIGSEYDEAKIYDQAVKKASEGIQAIADKVRRTRDAYHEANTAVWSQLKHVEIERTQSMLTEQEHDKAA